MQSHTWQNKTFWNISQSVGIDCNSHGIPMAFPWHSHSIPCLLCPSRTWAVRTTMDIVLDHWPHCLTSSVKHKRRMWRASWHKVSQCNFSSGSASNLHSCSSHSLLHLASMLGTVWKLRFKTSTTRSFLVQSLVPFLMFGSLENSNFWVPLPWAVLWFCEKFQSSSAWIQIQPPQHVFQNISMPSMKQLLAGAEGFAGVQPGFNMIQYDSIVSLPLFPVPKRAKGI